MTRRLLWLLILLQGCAAVPRTPVARVGEQIPSEDATIGDFHPLGVIDGKDDLFRSAAPLRDLAKAGAVDPRSDVARATAAVRMKDLYARGIRTIVSLENADASEKEDKAAWIALEKSSATEAGIHYVACPMTNSGAHSLQDATDRAVLQQLQAVSGEIMQDAQVGGVLIHCSAGHDRTGIVVAYLRMKFQHWTPDQAIAEMRAMGHNWIKYSSNGGTSSWHEDHLRAVAPMLQAAPQQP